MAETEKIKISENALRLIASVSEGSVRDSLSLMDRALVAQKNISICFEVEKAHSKFPESLISVKFDKKIFQSINDKMKLVKISNFIEEFVWKIYFYWI